MKILLDTHWVPLETTISVSLTPISHCGAMIELRKK